MSKADVSIPEYEVCFAHNKNSLISFFLYLTCGLKMGDFRCFFLLLFTQSFSYGKVYFLFFYLSI